MKYLLATLVIVTFDFAAVSQGERYETAVATGLPNGNGDQIADINIAENETGTVVSTATLPSGSYYWIKSGLTNSLSTGVTTLRGPAIFRARAAEGGPPFSSAVLTVKIMPESFDPNKTLILPPSTNQVSISLETSTNLVNWSVATNGIYGSPNEARFFRIHMQTQ
jgi:hypothetical protein